MPPEPHLFSDGAQITRRLRVTCPLVPESYGSAVAVPFGNQADWREACPLRFQGRRIYFLRSPEAFLARTPGNGVVVELGRFPKSKW